MLFNKLTLPNLLSLGRALILVPLIIWQILSDNGSVALILILIIIAGITDALDGFLARHFNQITFFGKTVDPLGDKMLILGCLVSLIYKLKLSYLPFLPLFGLELAAMAIGILPILRKDLREKAGANIWGKLKFATQLLLIMALLNQAYQIYPLPWGIIWTMLIIANLLAGISIIGHLRSS